MKLVIAVLAVTPMLASAVPSAALDLPGSSTVYRPIDPRCERLENRHFADCLPPQPWDDCRYGRWSSKCQDPYRGGRGDAHIQPLSEKVAALTAAVADGDLTAAARGLESLFSGSASAVSGAPAVSAAYKEEDKTIFYPDEKPAVVVKSAWNRAKVPAPKLLPIGCNDSSGCHSEIGKVIKDLVDTTTKPIEDHINNKDYKGEAIEKYGGCRLKGEC